MAPRTLLCVSALCVAAACSSGDDSRRSNGESSKADTRPLDEVAERSRLADSLVRRWSVDSTDWNKAILFHPAGAIIAFAGQKALILARDTGETLDEFRSCKLVAGGAFLLPDGRIVLVCGDGVNILHMSERRLERVLPLGQEPETGHLAGGILALAGGKRVLLIDVGDWQLLETIELPYAARDVAVSLDGTQVAVATHDRQSRQRAGNVMLIARGGAQREVHAEPGHAVAFSSDGRTLFAGVSGFDGYFIDIESGKKLLQVKTGSWLTSAAFLTPNVVAATGSDGLVIYERGHESDATVLLKASATGMAAETGRVCAGTRSGSVACFGGEALEPSHYQPPSVVINRGTESSPTTGVVPEMSGGPFGTGSRQIGKLASASGDRIVLNASDNFPPVGATGRLWKQATKLLGTSEIEFWIDIARVTVLESGDGQVTLQVLEERTVLFVNGRKQSQFTPGATTKLEW